MTIIRHMIDKYHPKTSEDKKNAIKEVLQEVVLAGLSKTGFFSRAAFYGGTALRLFHGMDRFSEDLDFSLLVADETFDLDAYLKPVRDVIHSLGLDFEVSKIDKTATSTIESAFIKGNTKETIMTIYPGSTDANRIIHNEKITIKFEVDVNPPLYANTEIRFRLLPFPYQVRIYDRESLFAGKVHAVLARSWKNRVKGRDLYDYVFFLSRGTNLNLKHLEARLKQTKTLEEHAVLNKEMLIEMLDRRFDTIDYASARSDVRPFIRDQSALDLWSSGFFKSITRQIGTDAED